MRGSPSSGAAKWSTKDIPDPVVFDHIVEALVHGSATSASPAAPARTPRSAAGWMLAAQLRAGRQRTGACVAAAGVAGRGSGTRHADDRWLRGGKGCAPTWRAGSGCWSMRCGWLGAHAVRGCRSGAGARAVASPAGAASRPGCYAVPAATGSRRLCAAPKHLQSRWKLLAQRRDTEGRRGGTRAWRCGESVLWNGGPLL